MNILKEALIQSGLISKKPVSLRDILMEIISLSDDKIGTVYLELSNYSDSFPVNIFIDVIETFHSPTDTDNPSKKKKVLIQSIIKKYNLESNRKLLYSDIFENLIEYKENSFVDLNSLSLKICQINQYERDMQMFKEKISSCIKSGIYHALGDMFYNRQDYAQAAEQYREAAEQGSVHAQYNLGYMLYYGQGVLQDYAQAAEWYRKAAEQGNVHAQYNLGYMLYYGQGVLQDYAQAAKWYRKAAEQGNFLARNYLNSQWFGIKV